MTVNPLVRVAQYVRMSDEAQQYSVDTSPTDEQIARASASLAPYLDAYVEYIHGCANSFAPQANDFGDSECFVYLQDQKKLVTREKRWSTIAKQVCPTHYFEE